MSQRQNCFVTEDILKDRSITPPRLLNKMELKRYAFPIKLKSVFLPNIKSPTYQQMPTSVGVLTSTDLDLIKKHIQTEKKVAHHADSQKLWAQRIQTQRKKKEEERFEKFKQEELARQEIDRQEEEYQASLKERQLRISNQQIFENQEKVRRLKSKMLLSEIEYENEKLKDINQHIQTIKKSVDAEHHHYMLASVMSQAKQEEAAKKQRFDKTIEVKSAVIAQREEVKDKWIKGYQNDRIEGQIIKQKAMEEEQQNFQKAQQMRQKAKEVRDEQLRFQERQYQTMKETTQKEEQEQKEREWLNQEKERVMEQRKAREKQKIQEAIDRRQRLFLAQEKQMKLKEDKFEQVLNNQIKEREQKTLLEEIKKEEVLAKMKKDMEDFRQMSIAQKQNQQHHVEMNDRDEAEVKQKAIRHLSQREQEQQELMLKRRVELQQFQRNQIQQKAKERRQQYLKELEEQRLVKEQQQDTSKKFNSWAQQCVDEWQEGGRNVLPLLSELKKSSIM